MYAIRSYYVAAGFSLVVVIISVYLSLCIKYWKFRCGFPVQLSTSAGFVAIGPLSNRPLQHNWTRIPVKYSVKCFQGA